MKFAQEIRGDLATPDRALLEVEDERGSTVWLLQFCAMAGGTTRRIGRDGGSTDGFLTYHAGLSSPPFVVDEFALFESHLTQNGAHYEMAAAYPADPSAL